jgi:hypothetical protein
LILYKEEICIRTLRSKVIGLDSLLANQSYDSESTEPKVNHKARTKLCEVTLQVPAEC